MKEISAALVKAQRAFGPALKSSTNPHFRSRYADLSACVEAVIEGLNNNGIALIQETHDAEGGVAVETVFIHESGERLSAGRFSVPAAKQDAQGYGSALTYARRYSLMAACGIAPEDDDGNAASRQPIKAKVETPVAPKATKEEPKAKPVAPAIQDDAPEISWDANWWTPEVASTLADLQEVNAFLIKKGKIKEGQTWRDVEDATYRKNINGNLPRFVEAVEKSTK
jgi:hypothetical protein